MEMDVFSPDRVPSMTAQLREELKAMRKRQEAECERLWKEHIEAEKALEQSPLQTRYDLTLEKWNSANRELEGLNNLLRSQP